MCTLIHVILVGDMSCMGENGVASSSDVVYIPDELVTKDGRIGGENHISILLVLVLVLLLLLMSIILELIPGTDVPIERMRSLKVMSHTQS